MILFEGLRRKRAIKQYNRKLPRQLYNDYGASTFFTPGQIATAAKKLRLAPEFIVFGYAMFLPKPIFEAMQATMQNPLTYEDARANLAPYNPTTSGADSNFYESKLGFFVPGDGGSGSTGF